MKTFQDFIGSNVFMIFSDIVNQDFEVKYKGKIKTHKTMAILNNRVNGNPDVDKSFWPAIQEKEKDKYAPEYLNFPWGKYQVFCDNIHIGECLNKSEISSLVWTYLKTIYKDM